MLSILRPRSRPPAVPSTVRRLGLTRLALEPALRAGAAHFPPARTHPAHLLLETGRPEEARSVLERGAKLGEQVAWLPLGAFYADVMGDDEAAEEAYRSGI